MVTGHWKHTFFILSPSSNGTEKREKRTYKCIILCRYTLFIGFGRPNKLIFYYTMYMPRISEHGRLHNYYYGDGVSGIIFVFFAWERVNLNAQTFYRSPWYRSFECNSYALHVSTFRKHSSQMSV